MNGRLSDVSGSSSIRSSNTKLLLESEQLAQIPRILTPKSRSSLTPDVGLTPVSDYEGQVYQRTKAGLWKMRYFVRGGGKLYIFTFMKLGPPKHVLDLSHVSATVLGLLDNRYHAFVLTAEDVSKTYGCAQREECLQWARRLSGNAGADFSPMDDCTRDFNEREQRSVIPKMHTLPVQLQEGLTLLRNQSNWLLISAGRWQHGPWIKTTLPLKASAEEALELLFDSRTTWDPHVKSSRSVVEVGATKLVLEEFKEFSVVMLTSITYEQPGSFFVLQDSVKHLAYARNPILFTDCFEIKQHPVAPKLILITRVTQLKLPWRLLSSSVVLVKAFHDSLEGMKTHLKIKRFLKRFEKKPQEARVTIQKSFHEPDTPKFQASPIAKYINRVKQYPFDDFFVYGKGGRYERDEASGGIVLADMQLLSKQRNVLSYLIRSMGSNLLKGKSVMNVSLPVNIFCPESLLQRMCNMFGYAPEFLDRAAKTEDPILRMKLVITFVVTMIHLSMEQKKPFNPILGETLQGFIGECPIYAEQTSHHPPVGSFQYYGHGYKLEGSHEFIASTSANSITARQRGISYIQFSDGGKCYFSLPTAVIGGIMFGKRTLNQQGVLTVIDLDHLLFAELLFNPDRKSAWVSLFSRQNTLTDCVRGQIVKINPTHPVFEKKKFKAIFQDGMSQVKTNPEDNEGFVSIIDGCWLTHLSFDGESFWEIEKYRPWLLTEPDELLPSDCSLRSDLRKLAENDEENAQLEKERLEVLQRHDRTLRAHHKHA